MTSTVLVMGSTPERPCAVILARIMHVIQRTGLPLQFWPRMDVARQMWTGLRGRLLMVRMKVYRLRCPVGVPVAVYGSLVGMRSARDAILYF